MQVDMKDTVSRVVGSQFIFRFDFQLNFQQLLFYADLLVSIFALVQTPHDYEAIYMVHELS